MIRNLALRDADYRKLLGGTVLNQQGMSGEQVVIGLLIYEATGTTVWVGIILAIYFIPFFIFGILSGAIADWIDRRTLLRGIELVTAVVLCSFAITTIGEIKIGFIVVFTILTGSLRALHQPVRSSYAYDLVGKETLVAAMGLLNLASRMGQLIGALVAGFMMELYGPAVSLSCLAIGHSLAFLPFRYLRSPGIATVDHRVPIVQNVREYIIELSTNRLLLLLLGITAAVEIFGFSFATALPQISKERLEFGAEGLGWLQGTRAIAGILAGAIFATFGFRVHRGAIYVGIILLFGIALTLLSLTSAPILIFGTVFLVSLAAASFDILSQSMMQLSVANELRGRAMGVWVFALGFGPLGHLELGVISDSFGLGIGLLLNGLILITIAVFIGLMARKFRQF